MMCITMYFMMNQIIYLNFTITKVTITFTNGDILLLKMCQGRPWEYDSKRH